MTSLLTPRNTAVSMTS